MSEIMLVVRIKVKINAVMEEMAKAQCYATLSIKCNGIFCCLSHSTIRTFLTLGVAMGSPVTPQISPVHFPFLFNNDHQFLISVSVLLNGGYCDDGDSNDKNK